MSSNFVRLLICTKSPYVLGQRIVSFASKGRMIWGKRVYALAPSTPPEGGAYDRVCISSPLGEVGGTWPPQGGELRGLLFPKHLSPLHARFNLLKHCRMWWKIHLSQMFHTLLSYFCMCNGQWNNFSTWWNRWKIGVKPYVSPDCAYIQWVATCVKAWRLFG